jgi:hypothetical protein
VQPLFPFQFLLCKRIVGFFVELFALGQMALGKFTSAGYVPDLDMVFVFRFSNAAPN